jgi:glutamyl-Q tRNA(Asp) synthetase
VGARSDRREAQRSPAAPAPPEDDARPVAPRLPRPYTGRFAPSPTGPLHAGSLVAALASWLDARAHGGRWLVRLEDVDTPRCVAGTDRLILAQLAACGLLPDEPPWHQSARGEAYAAALARLAATGAAYPCDCTRREIDAALAAQGIVHQRFAERVYPGTCRPRPDGSGGPRGRPHPAWRLRAEGVVDWTDRRLGAQVQDVGRAVGDFVLRRGDGVWAYQLAVVVDDAAQGVTDVVRGADLADNTARQILLQRALGLPTPSYLHTPLVLGTDGHKLSKQNGAAALDLADPRRALGALQAAAAVLGLPRVQADTPAAWLAQAVPAWAGMMRALAPPPTPNPEPR